ncbi:MAG TPA: DNA repair protein RecO [Candidatus Cloacimonadota bacterium]|nr:DNA repair protein RecO [Candidatus Cloacimonadota bacterium]
MSLSRESNLCGIILKKTIYHETSLILDIFTPVYGSIPVMAKGVRREKSQVLGLLEILNELEITLYKNPASEWYIFKNAELIKSHLYETNFQTGILMQAAAEIYRQLIMANSDFDSLYELLEQYLVYIRTVPQNGIAVFWRFMLRLFKLLGIELDTTSCVICHENHDFVAYYPQQHGFICRTCLRPVHEDRVVRMNREQAELIAQLHRIGNLLPELIINKTTITQINRIFLAHLSENFHQRFYLKTLEML